MNGYPSTEHLDKLKDALSVYYAVFEQIKPKRLNSIELDYKSVYNLQWDARVIIRDIEMSHLLGCNEIVVPHLQNEYNELFERINKLQSGINELKKYGELLTNMKPLTELLKKDLNAMCTRDLKWLTRMFGVQ